MCPRPTTAERDDEIATPPDSSSHAHTSSPSGGCHSTLRRNPSFTSAARPSCGATRNARESTREMTARSMRGAPRHARYHRDTREEAVARGSGGRGHARGHTFWRRWRRSRTWREETEAQPEEQGKAVRRTLSGPCSTPTRARSSAAASSSSSSSPSSAAPSSASSCTHLRASAGHTVVVARRRHRTRMCASTSTRAPQTPHTDTARTSASLTRRGHPHRRAAHDTTHRPPTLSRRHPRDDETTETTRRRRTAHLSDRSRCTSAPGKCPAASSIGVRHIGGMSTFSCCRFTRAATAFLPPRASTSGGARPWCGCGSSP